MGEPLPYVAAAPLIDHHCHGVLGRDLDGAEFAALLTEADAPGVLAFDSGIGFAVRRWCAPVLDLPAHAAPEDYLARRAELGAHEVARRFLRATGTETLLLDTGFAPEAILSPAEMGALAGADAYEIVRLEQVAEQVAATGTTAAGFAGDFQRHLAERATHAVGLKSIAAYRAGLELSGERPSAGQVAEAAGRWLAAIDKGAPVRLCDEVLHRFLVWCGADLGLPIQFHTGLGDADLDLHRCNPLLLTGLLRALRPTGVPVMLLHNYPYHREAGYLAQVFPHVYVDAGLASHNLGHRASALIAETLELTPYGKFLFSSDAFGLPELYHLGALLFRRGLSDFLREGLDDAAFDHDDAVRVTGLMCAGNARRVYGLGAR